MKIKKFVSKHPLLINFIFLVIGLVIGVLISLLINYYFGVQIGHSRIFYNGSGICINAC